ncbi:hypothetical protein DIPPA_10879 [Diplonema papillatum]|nr:hypothetical protein DIPPA_10879 [Diplonema papillatum]
MIRFGDRLGEHVVSTLDELPVRLVDGILCHSCNHIADPAAQAARSKVPLAHSPRRESGEADGVRSRHLRRGRHRLPSARQELSGRNKTVRFRRQPHGWLARGNIKLPVTGAVIGGEGVEEDVKKGLELVFARLREYGLIGDDCVDCHLPCDTSPVRERLENVRLLPSPPDRTDRLASATG